MEQVNHELIDIALQRVPGADFERFVNAFYPAIVGVEFVPTGGTHDGGADAYQDAGIFEGKKPNTFYQASVQENHRQKIRGTVERLRDFGRMPKSLVYITSRPIQAPDKDEEELTEELDVFVKIRSRNWIVSNINHSPQTVAAFNTYLKPHLAFLQEVGGATFIENPKHLQSRAVCVFLGQEVERRRSKSPLLESVTDSLILWSLMGTDPEKGIFLTRQQILEKIEDALPTARHFLRGLLGHRLKTLASKGNPSGREIRWYRKEDKYCLPFETRQIVEQENIEDEYLKVQLLKEFETAAQAYLEGLESPNASPMIITQLAVRAVECTFENTGLELAAFLEGNEDAGAHLTISDNVDSVIQELGISGNTALVAKDIAMKLIRRAFYESTEAQRLYFGKLSRTYSLLFSLRADPRIVEYFRSMSSQFVLFVGSDILIRALSEHYLRPEDQMTCNMLKILRDAGSELILCEPALQEVHHHLKTTDREFINYFADCEPHVTVEIARHATKILIRAYFYAKLRPTGGIKGPTGWKSYLGQFCEYKSLHSQSGRDQLKCYLLEKFKLGFLSNEDLLDLTSEEEVKALASDLRPFKKEDILAENDARIILSVFGKRKQLGEQHKSNPYGYRTWWLTQETLVRKATADLERRKGSRYIIRPEFILNFISLSPTTEEVRKTYRSVFPTLLGIRLSNRMREDVFHDVMLKAKEAFQVDEARAKVIMGDLSNKLKGDFFKRYEAQWNGTLR